MQKLAMFLGTVIFTVILVCVVVLGILEYETGTLSRSLFMSMSHFQETPFQSPPTIDFGSPDNALDRMVSIAVGGDPVNGGLAVIALDGRGRAWQYFANPEGWQMLSTKRYLIPPTLSPTPAPTPISVPKQGLPAG